MDQKIIKEQLASFEAQLEALKADLYRVDGAICALKHLLSLSEHVQPAPIEGEVV